MPAHAAWPVACFSYLAAAELWQVPRFPLANNGAEVVSIDHSIAADAPMAAAVLTALGVPTLLLANDVGEDQNGAEVRAWLERYGVSTTARVAAGTTTPQIVVVGDGTSTRTWFAHLPGVVDGLAARDLSPLADTAFAYIDCYQLIEVPAIRAIWAARTAGVPTLLNLGGSPLSPSVMAAARGFPRLVIQTSINEAASADASHVAGSILSATRAAWVVVTAGAEGALARSERTQLVVPGFRVPVCHTHCAGAAFSGGFIYGLLHERPVEECLTLACASGALRCQRAHCEPMPVLEELHAVIRLRRSSAAPVA